MDDNEQSALETSSIEEVREATERVIARLVALAEELDDPQRSVLANLLGPTIDLALDDEGDDVAGFSAGDSASWAAVSAAVRGAGLRVISRDDPER